MDVFTVHVYNDDNNIGNIKVVGALKVQILNNGINESQNRMKYLPHQKK